MRRASGSAKAMSSAVSTTPMAMKKKIAEPMTRPAFSVLPLPMHVPSMTVMPVASPVRTNVTRLIMLLPVDTPESPSVVPNQPTTRTSTAP